MGAPRLTLVTLALLCALAGLLALSGVPAGAAVTHDYLSQIGEVPAEGPKGEAVAVPGPLFAPTAMTVDSGNLWVSEFVENLGQFRVDQFNAASGAFVSQLAQPGPSLNYFDNGIAVGHSTGEPELYVGADTPSEGGSKGAIGVYNSTGELQNVWSGADTPEKAFGCFECNTGPGDVAVDSSTSLGDWAAGDVFVSSPGQGVVDVFAPEVKGGEKYVPVPQLTGPEPGVPFRELSAVAVSAFNGDVLVAAGAVVYVFEPTALNEYALVREMTGTLGGAFERKVDHVAVDEVNGDIYISEERGTVVYQFGADGAYLGRLTGAGSPSGDFRSVTSIAVDPETHRVYVGDQRHTQNVYESENGVVDVFGENIVIPDVTTGAATGQRATGEGRIEATLNGTVNPDKMGAVTCQFDWGTTSALGEVAACSAPVPDGESPEPVHATLSGLAPDTKYFYRLQATDANGTSPGESWQIQEFTTTGPGISGETVSAVRAESVTFDATVNPHNAPTSYYFQYGTSASYGSDVPAAPGAAVGSGEGGLEVTQHIQSLSAATVYHYRVVAVTELAPGEPELFYGPDQTFKSQTVGLPLQLPDGRAYEMVSPPQKEGAVFDPIDRGGLLKASAKGDALVDPSFYQAPEANPAGEDNRDVDILFGRDANGWSSKSLQPPHKIATGATYAAFNEYWFFSEDLSKGLLEPGGPFQQLAPEATESTTYIHTNYSKGNPGEPCVNGCFQPLVSAANVPPGTEFGEEKPCRIVCGPMPQGATPDASHIVLWLRPSTALTSTSTEGYESNLYEWSAGTLQMVNLLPEGEVNGTGGRVGVGASLGGSEIARHAISDDGSRIVWQTANNTGTGHIYLRDTVKGETIRLDRFQGVKEPPAGYVVRGPSYMTASSDASHIFFLDEVRLTADATAQTNAPDLYEYDLDAPLGSRLTDLTGNANAHEAANVQTVVGASEDGSYVYFAAAGALAQGAAPGHCAYESELVSAAEAGTELTQLCNIYVRHGGTTTLVAALSQEDYANWKRELSSAIGRVSPNGLWLSFMSNRSLTGYNTTDAVSHLPAEEVYLYNASTRKLVCGSCNPAGARPVGVPYTNPEFGLTSPLVLSSGPGSLFVRTKKRESTWVAANIPAWSYSQELFEVPAYQSRYLSDSGRLFFNSHDALVTQDVNGTWDVYEYEPPGVGDCNSSMTTFSEKANGCVSLVSSGTSGEESAFLDASETGGDVFFLTLSKLAPQDFDNALDIYDARECSSKSPCLTPPQVEPPPCDSGDACKPAPSPQPEIFGAPPSATFSGSGNVPTPVSEKGPRAGKSPALTPAQKRARALRACHRKKSKRRRAACERQARARYAASRFSKVNATKRGRG